MGSYALIAGIVLLSFVLYALWERRDRKHEQTARQVAEDLSGMGELVAASLSPRVDPDRCIGSGACVAGCPEKVVIALVGGRAKLVNPLGCVGHGACESACPVGAITLVYGTRTRGVELPRIDPHFETNRQGVYIIGELGGMGLIRNAVEQGRQAAEHVIAGSPEQERPPRRGLGDALDAVVVGAGPAGIAATLRMMEAGLSVRLLEREGFGGTILHYPRAKVVMTGELNLPLYGRVRRRTMSKEQLVALWQDIREKTDPPLSLGQLVEGLSPEPDGMWRVHASGGDFRAANVLLALGVRGSPRKLGVPGEEQPKVAYRLLEPQEFEGRHVLVVGGGNSAVESALSLSDAGCCASVTISYRKGAFARCRGENRARIEQAIAEGRVRAAMPTQVQEIGADHVVLRDCDGEQSQRLQNDAVIVQIGGTPPATLLRSFGIEIVTKYGEA
jgi:thioredoxin reductase/NAD-dependent dihydropyrimidine dehydrogenase PreA subunit